MSDAHKRNGESGSESSALADLIDRLTGKMQAGEPIDWDGVLRQHPDHAEEVLRLRPALGALGRLSKSGPEELSGLAAPAGAEDGSVSGLLGDFRIGREIGRGGMGVVYEAEQMSLGRRVALKVLPFAGAMDPRRLQRFQNEARAAACLNHPHIVPVYYVGSERGVSFYAMQYIDGKTAADLIQELRQPSVTRPAPAAASPDDRTTACPAPGAACDPAATTETTGRQSTPTMKSAVQNAEFFRRAAGWAVQAAEALDHAHQAAIVHRDVKPANLLLDGGGHLWITDFGLAHVRQGEDGLTMTGDLVGTLRYMSPEQALAKRVPIDHRTDVYSLGATLYELLTLRPALDGTDRQQILRQIALEEPPAPRRLNKAIPHELEIIVLKAMEKNAADRYGTAREMADDLRRWLDDRPIRARRASVLQRLRKMALRHRPAVTAAAVCLLLVLVVAAAGIGWVVRDREARLARLNGQIELILEDVDRLEGEKKWPEALAAAERAEAALSGGEANDDLRRRVGDMLREPAFVGRLDRIRQEHDRFVQANHDDAGAARDYALAFHDYGVDVESLPVEEAVARLREKPALAEPVAAALDDWAFAQGALGEGESRWKALVAVARGLDPDPLRDRLRAAWGHPFTPELQADLRQLAEGINVKTQGPATISKLARALDSVRLWDDVLRIEREGQYAYPADFWLNFTLGNSLRVQKDYAGAVRYYTAAVSLRPDSAAAHTNLGIGLHDQGKLDEAVAVLRQAVELDPKDYAAHFNLGTALRDQGKLDEAVAVLRQTLEIEPEDYTTQCILGSTLRNQGKLDEAIAVSRQSIARYPYFCQAYNNFGNALRDQGKPDKAVVEFRQAITLYPNYAEAHYSLSNVLYDMAQLDEAVKDYRRAIELDPKLTKEHSNLGIALKDKRQLEGAIQDNRRAIELDPNCAPAYCNLGCALRETGKLTASLEAYRIGHQLGSKRPDWSYPSAQRVREAEFLVEMLRKLDLVLEGKEKPADDHERLALAQFCKQPFKKCYAASSRFFAEAFTHDAKLAANLQTGVRYNAACAAALAGCGRGEDAPADEADRAALRAQALTWLRADLAAWKPNVTDRYLSVLTQSTSTLTHWNEDDDLAGVRGDDSLAKLPETERHAWRQLWTDLDALLAKAKP